MQSGGLAQAPRPTAGVDEISPSPDDTASISSKLGSGADVATASQNLDCWGIGLVFRPEGIFTSSPRASAPHPLDRPQPRLRTPPAAAINSAAIRRADMSP